MLLGMLLCLPKMVMIQPLPKPALCSFAYFLFFCNLFFLGAQCVLGFLILLSEQYFHSNLKTMFLPSVYGLLIIILKQCWLLVVFGPLIIFVILYLLVFVPTLHATLWLHVICFCFIPLVISSTSVTCIVVTFVLTHTYWWGHDPSVTYIHRGGILLLSQFFWHIPIEGILSFFGFVSNLHLSKRNLVT